MSDPEALARELEAHPDFRVLRRLPADFAGGPPIAFGRVLRAAIVDVETTGMDPEKDRVIELGMIVFEYGAESGQVGSVVGRYGGLEDPGRAIPSEATAINHITDAMVKGKRLDDAAIAQLLGGVGLVIAHNAGFDRPFVEARLPLFADVHWACSIEDIPWRKHGYGRSALEFLAYRAGLFYEAHRAEIDCLAVLAVLGRVLGESGIPAMKALLDSARLPSVRVTALGSPFESKDVLKARGYRWNGESKVWAREVPPAEKDAELEWLNKAVYGGQGATVEVETLTAKQRYSARKGNTVRQVL